MQDASTFAYDCSLHHYSICVRHYVPPTLLVLISLWGETQISVRSNQQPQSSFSLQLDVYLLRLVPLFCGGAPPGACGAVLREICFLMVYCPNRARQN